VTGLEQAIRNALDRAERANPAIRARIYQSARNALDTGLSKQDIQDRLVIERQRQRLEATIQTIEDEELERLRMAARLEKIIIENTPFDPPEPEVAEVAPAIAAVAPPAELPVREEPVVPEAPPARTEPQFDAENGSLSALSATRDTIPERTTGPTLTAEREDGRKTAGRRQARAAKRAAHIEEDAAWADPSSPLGRTIGAKKRQSRRQSGSWIISLFVYCVLLGAVGFGGWWIYSTGMIAAALHGGGNFDFIPKELQTEDFDPTPQAAKQLDPRRGFTSDWVEIFKPGMNNALTPAAQATLDEIVDSDGKATTIASNAPDQDGEVRIAVPADIMAGLAGKVSTVAVTLRADGDEPSQIYIQCALGTLGDCGRHRFTASGERVDELIRLDYKGKTAPAGPGYIIINSDLTGQGKAIRLYGIRIRSGE
jgi:hypothetical protein